MSTKQPFDEVALGLQALVDAESAATNGAACMLRVESPGGDRVWHHVSGGVERGGTPATPSTPFRIASITKTFTAAVIVQLASEGLLTFDDRMCDLLPSHLDDIIDAIHRIDGVSYGRSITVSHLLRHQSGLFDYASCPAFFGEILADPGRVWTPRMMLEGAIAWGVPHCPPGGGYGYDYSDTGYVLLGLIIENVDGRPLHESYRHRILDPLGMDATYLEGHEPHRGRELSHPHEGTFDCFPIHGSADWAGGGLVSDVDDLARFARALASGRVVSGEWRDQMFEWRFRTLDPARHSPGFVGYGYGVEVREIDGIVLRGHRGHWGSWMHIHPETGFTITGTNNDANRPPHDIVIAATRLVLGDGSVVS